jgi:hypothetical protein
MNPEPDYRTAVSDDDQVAGREEVGVDRVSVHPDGCTGDRLKLELPVATMDPGMVKSDGRFVISGKVDGRLTRGPDLQIVIRQDLA